jgi:hypothetical protein
LVVFKGTGSYSQYFTKVGRNSDFWGMWRLYTRHIPQKSGLFKMFRELLILKIRY